MLQVYGTGVKDCWIELNSSLIPGPAARRMPSTPTVKQQQRTKKGNSKEAAACPQPN